MRRRLFYLADYLDNTAIINRDGNPVAVNIRYRPHLSRPDGLAVAIGEKSRPLIAHMQFR